MGLLGRAGDDLGRPEEKEGLCGLGKRCMEREEEGTGVAVRVGEWMWRGWNGI